MNETGGPEALKLATMDKLTPTADDHTPVKNVYAGLNFIDTVVQRGKIPSKLPLIPGIGSKVGQSYPVGARVAYMAFGAKPHAEYTSISAGAAAVIPGGVSWEDATAVFEVKKGDNVLVRAGAGGMGQLLTQISSYRGANVVATVSTASKAELSKANGAKVAVRYSDDARNAKDWVQDALVASTDGKGFEVVYDSVGKATWDRDKEVLKPRGPLVCWFAGKSLAFTHPMLFNYVTPGEFQSRARVSLSGSRWVLSSASIPSFRLLMLARPMKPAPHACV
ncbi:hypothetical protein BDQ17DRAFT_1438028 [Cyathus striatus]|nr:hypothetical protein BDQ17DRAFT_1438028 [Cyathus striatus]